jgi:nucleotide-binding universal stress UspA family protein
MLQLKTILHPTDFSAAARVAEELALSFAHGSGARLVVLHVAAPLSAIAQREVIGDRVVGRPFEKLWRRLEQIRPLDSRVSTEHRLEVGNAGVEILRVARESAADLIVMGTLGRAGFGRLLMGSVAEQVVRNAQCPVLTVRSPTLAISSPSETNSGWTDAGYTVPDDFD